MKDLKSLAGLLWAPVIIQLAPALLAKHNPSQRWAVCSDLCGPDYNTAPIFCLKSDFVSFFRAERSVPGCVPFTCQSNALV